MLQHQIQAADKRETNEIAHVKEASNQEGKPILGLKWD